MPRIITYILQSFTAFVLLLAVYMLLALMDYKGGIGGLIGLTFFQPIMGAILSGLTVLICTLIGLPIRLSARIRAWWVRKPFIPLLLLIAAVVLMVVAFLPGQMHWGSYWEDDREYQVLIPNLYYITIAWFSLAFSVLHFYPLAYILAKK